MISPWSQIIQAALAEDIGRGDITTNALVEAEVGAEAVFVAKEDLVVCGLPVVVETFRQVDPGVRLRVEIPEGKGARAGNTICLIRGSARSLLTAERVALNFFQNLSGVATLTRRYVELVEGTQARIVDTRKTTPGMRLLQKYAVRVGGGHNHRLGLDDGVLIKDNHLLVAGGLREAVRRVRQAVAHLHQIEVECSTLAQVQEALEESVQVILLDNMAPPTMQKAVDMAAGKALLEASGNISLETVREVALTGVDLISVGAITHSAGSRDVSMRMVFDR